MKSPKKACCRKLLSGYWRQLCQLHTMRNVVHQWQRVHRTHLAVFFSQKEKIRWRTRNEKTHKSIAFERLKLMLALGDWQQKQEEAKPFWILKFPLEIFSRKMVPHPTFWQLFRFDFGVFSFRATADDDEPDHESKSIQKINLSCWCE